MFGGVEVKIHILLVYPQRKSIWYPLDRKWGGSQSHSGCGGREKKSLFLPGNKPPTI